MIDSLRSQASDIQEQVASAVTILSAANEIEAAMYWAALLKRIDLKFAEGAYLDVFAEYNETVDRIDGVVPAGPSSDIDIFNV